jgi:hypothetical protein
VIRGRIGWRDEPANRALEDFAFDITIAERIVAAAPAGRALRRRKSATDRSGFRLISRHSG